MSITKKAVCALLLGLALFSGSAKAFLSIAANAVESDALAGGGKGATCD